MRQLVLTWQRSGTVVTLVSATLLPNACGGKSAEGDAVNASSHSGGATSAAGGATSTATTTLANGGSRPATTPLSGGTTAAGGTVGSAKGGTTANATTTATTNATADASSIYPFAARQFLNCPFGNNETYVVPIPEEGVLAAPTAICAAPPPVTSNWAARVEIDPDSSGNVWKGIIAFVPGIGTPLTELSATVTSVEGASAWPAIAVGAFMPERNGYAVTITWPSNLSRPGLLIRVSIQVKFEVMCGTQQASASATSLLYGCVQRSGELNAWASSGDTCDTCVTICEMAPSPVPIATAEADQLPLGQRLRATVHVLSRDNGALVLWAEHDGGTEGYEYEWQVSSGQLLYAERDVAVWLPSTEQELQLIQVGIEGERATGIASMTWEQAA